MNEPRPKGSTKKLALLFLLVVVLLTGGVAAYFLTQDKEADHGKQTHHTDTATDHNQSQEQTTKNNTLKSFTFVGGYPREYTVTFEYPDGWEVTERVNHEYEDGSSLKSVVTGSPSGHYMHILELDGVGGYCEPNRDTYTLIKKLATKTPNLFLTEYKYSDGTKTELGAERFNAENSDTAHEALKEGETGKNTCLIAGYSAVAEGIFLRAIDSADFKSDFKKLTYEDIKNDTDFIKMLQSLSVVEK